MEEIINKELAKKIIEEIKGETRGIAIKDDFDYVLKRKGKDGVKMLEQELEKLGYPIKYKEIEPMKFYPSGLEPVIMLACKKLFNYTKDDFKALGAFSAKIPSVIRIFIRYLGSLDLIVKSASKMWHKYYTSGELKVIELNKEKKYIIIRLENFALHPVYCIGLEGYFPALVGMVIKGKITCQETKCIHRGDEYHEFIIKWE